MTMVSHELTSKLRISGPSPSEREREDARKALRDGRDLLAREGYTRITLKTIIWRLMQDAARTEATLADRERAWLAANGRSAWPELARPSEENRQVEWEWEMGVLQGAMQQERTPMPKLDIYKANHERMLVVLGWLKHMKARTFERFQRDRQVVLDLARGVPPRIVRLRYFRRDSCDSAITMVKHKMLRDVELALTNLGANCINVAS